LGGNLVLKESIPGSGSTFEVTINPQDLTGIAWLTEEEFNRARFLQKNTASDMDDKDHGSAAQLQGLRILVVEDSEITQEDDVVQLEIVENDDYVLQEMPYDVYDLDFDGRIDYVEWVVPHLSSQEFEIVIEITNAEHLNSLLKYFAVLDNEPFPYTDTVDVSLSAEDYKAAEKLFSKDYFGCAHKKC